MKDRRTDSFLRQEEVIARTTLSESTIRRRERAGTFPRRVMLGANSVAWYASDIDDWIADPMGYRVSGAA
ncbi:AlpA family phage regulatory protein [Sphingomonas sp. AP4-R1]|uniref:helix-turn-helix transcriptional regulator n=1 Tax=Sphingomonas sp. AP4-R1 TaxID=2735134 RepID=UPI0014935E27|nr:AlpA family phage regulatory protein [Sphingomonas sp. AP4-R1]QJU56827.1 AlpA family phage regulatory protein [Sphingomonas sp. AP4-R1]